MARPRRLPKVLTPDEQALFLRQFNKRYVSSLRNLVAIQLMLYCGLRCGEVVAIRPEHVDTDSCRLLVREGKGGKDRVVWFSDDMRDLIVRWLERRPESPWLLCTRHATQVSTHQGQGWPGRANNVSPASARTETFLSVKSWTTTTTHNPNNAIERSIVIVIMEPPVVSR